MTWLLKLLSGFKILGPGAMEKIGKIIFISIICISIGFGFWKIFLEKKIKNIETYQDCNVTQNKDCSVQVMEAVKKAEYKPIVDLKLWKLLRISFGG